MHKPRRKLKTGRKPGKQLPRDPIICLHDPTGTFGGQFDRLSFAGTLFDGYWPDGSVWELSARYRGQPSHWRLTNGKLHEINGDRVLVATCDRDKPALKLQERA